MSIFLRIFLPLLATVLLASGLTRAVSAQQVGLGAADCAASPFALDCACVIDGFAKASTSFTPPQRAVAARMTRLMIGASKDALDDGEQRTLIDILPALMPWAGSVTDTCKAKGGGADPLATAEREDIRTLCERSRHIVDCDCIGFRYAKAANQLPPAGQDYIRAVLGQQLGVQTSPASDEIPVAVMVQHADQGASLSGSVRDCAIPTPSAMAAYRNSDRLPAPTLEARASAAPEASLRLWCEAFGGTSADCACQVQVTRDLLPARAFRFHGESMKAQALVELGRLDGPQRFVHAARAMGAVDQAKALYNDTAKALEGVTEIADNTCAATARELQGR